MQYLVFFLYSTIFIEIYAHHKISKIFNPLENHQVPAETFNLLERASVTKHLTSLIPSNKTNKM